MHDAGELETKGKECARADEIDRLIAENIGKASVRPDLPAAGWAVAAMGGYGRRRLSPGSDIDLAIVHAGLSETAVKALVREVFYPLWDDKLPLSHTVKTLRQAVASARGDLHWLTACIDARFLGGDGELFATFTRKVLDVAARGQGRPFFSALAAAAEKRHRRAGHAGRLLEPDVKDAGGGLRDIQAVLWIEKVLAHGGRDPLLSKRDAIELAEADDFLWRVRAALHESAGKGSDRLTLESRTEVAARIFPDEDQAIRTFGRKFFGYTRATARISDAVFASLTPKRRPAPTPGADLAGARLGPDDLWRALGLGEEAPAALERLAETGVLQALVPQWRGIEALATFDANHLFAVDTHSFFTVAELAAFDSSADMLISSVYKEIAHLDWLLLGALLHDIGKGRSGPHAAAGANLAVAAAARLGIDSHGVETIGFLVGHHLLLNQVATRRDLNDKRVIEGVAASVGDSDRLKMLYLLTIADALATGPTAWNAWRATLVRELFLKTLDLLEGGRGPDTAGQIKLEEKHFDLLDDNEETRIVFFPDGPGLSELAVVAHDRPGLFSRIAGALALSGMNVLAAQVYTTGNGRALEVFKIASAFEGRITEEARERLHAGVVKAVAGRVALPYHMDELGRRYQKKTPGAKAARVAVDNVASDKHTIIEVYATDEIGLLYKITNALFELNLDIHLAKISTVGDEAVDVFYVSDLNGGKITDGDHLSEIEKNILFRLQPPS